MNLADLATLVSGLVSLITIYYTRQALLEVIKQRESTYKPELVLGSGMFYAYNYDTGKETFPRGFAIEHTFEEKERGYTAPYPSLTPLVLDLYNLGLAAAKNIEISCTTDIDKWLYIIDELGKEIEGELPFTFTSGHIGFIQFMSAPYTGMGGKGLGEEDITLFNHVLPVSIESKP